MKYIIDYKAIGASVLAQSLIVNPKIPARVAFTLLFEKAVPHIICGEENAELVLVSSNIESKYLNE